MRLMLAGLVFGLVGSAPADTMFRVDARHSGTYEAAGVPVFHRVGTPNYRAAAHDSFYDQLVIGFDRLMSAGAVLSTPVIDGNTLFFGSWDGQLYALE